MDKFTIGQISKISGLPTKTIRFYEDSGVISPADREENGYRTYSKTAVEQLKILKYTRDLGLPLAEIKKLMKGCESGNCEHSKKEVESSIDGYLALLDDKIEQMQTLKAKLSGLSRRIKNPDKSECKDGMYCCNLLYQLTDETILKGGEKNERSN